MSLIGEASSIYVYSEDDGVPVYFGHGTGKVTATTGTTFTVTGKFKASGTWTVTPLHTPRLKYGDMVQDPDGRIVMVIGRAHEYGQDWEVIPMNDDPHDRADDIDLYLDSELVLIP